MMARVHEQTTTITVSIEKRVRYAIISGEVEPKYKAVREKFSGFSNDRLKDLFSQLVTNGELYRKGEGSLYQSTCKT